MLDTQSSGDMPKKKLSVAMVLYPRMTLLDFIGPATALAFYADIHLVASTMKSVSSDQGVTILPTCLPTMTARKTWTCHSARGMGVD